MRGTASSAKAVAPLAAAGLRRSRAVTRAVAFLRGQQNGDGGFPLNRGGPSNAQSAAWAAQALIAAGRSPASVRRSGRSPLDYLRSLTAPDGSVRYSRTSGQTPVWVTAQALTALSGKAFPLGPVRRARARAAGGPAAATAGAGAAAARGRRAGSAGGTGAAAAGAPTGLVRDAMLAGLAAGYLID